MPSQGLVRRMEEKKKREEKIVEEIPFRGMEQDLSTVKEDQFSGEFQKSGTEINSAGEEPLIEEPGYWVGMDPEDSSDTDMNKSRYAVWPGGEKGEETTTSASFKKPEETTQSYQKTTGKMERVGHELHGPDEVVLPGGTIKTPGLNIEEGRVQKASGGMEFDTRVRKGDNGRHSDDWRIVSGKGGQVGRKAEDELKKRQEHDL